MGAGCFLVGGARVPLRFSPPDTVARSPSCSYLSRRTTRRSSISSSELVVMRKKIVAANWKMNMTQSEAARFVSTFLLEVGESRDVEIVLVPPFTAIAAVSAALEQAQHIKVGAQNMHWERSGAF